MNKYASDLASPDSDLSQTSIFGQQQAAALTSLPDPDSLKDQMPPNVTRAMIEGNIGLQWGMNEFRYGNQKAVLVKRLSQVKPEDVRQAAKKYLSASARSTVSLQPANH